jgi:anti-sigma regulatory factor (Ser/Thr protein kinase)
MTDADRVVLVVPSKAEYARTVRLAAAELAARAGMDIDGIDDVRMAVEEAFVFASERAVRGDLEFAFVVAPGSVELTVGPLGAGPAQEDSPDRGEMYARFILETICDEFELTGDDGAGSLRLVKRSG